MQSLQRAIECDRNCAEAHNNLGNVFQELERLDDAVRSYASATACAPHFLDAHNNLGSVLHKLERHDEAAESYLQVLQADSANADAHNNLGLVRLDQGRLDDAIACYRRALDAAPDYADAYGNLGVALNAQGACGEALAHFDRKLALTRGANHPDASRRAAGEISRAKIDHDIEQFRYLAAQGCEPARFSALARRYEGLRDTVDWPEDRAVPVKLESGLFQEIAESFNRPLHLAGAPRLPGCALNEALDTAAITSRYFDTELGVTFFDGLLAPQALASLRRFLLESTIWYDFRYHRGYLGAFLNDGLACPLILQIAENFRRMFPDIFQDHRLIQCWAYKYDSRLQGIDVHADVAAVNVNFWVTPDRANRNRDGGGLIVYEAEAPQDWAFAAYNRDQGRIRGYLAAHPHEKHVVPHAQNRVVLFNSDLFHETDDIDFEAGYENRRINVTMLFGRRGDA